MSTIDRNTLSGALFHAWSADTSSATTWDPQVPSRGQCAATALVLQDHLGGELMRTECQGQSHYWLRLPNGHDEDLTAAQFGFKVSHKGGEPRERDYVLSSSDTMARYEVLSARVRSFLGE